MAECLAEAFTTEGLKRALCNGATLLGKGSNVLCGDVDGIVVLNRTSEVSVEGNTVLAESGVGLIALSRFAASRNLGGLEWACGIPGSLGGAAKMNASAFGGSFADKLTALYIFEDGREVRVPKSEIKFAYRKGCDKPVLRAEFVLNYRPREESERIMRELTARRFAAQPKGHSLGSVFKNPSGFGLKSAGYYIEKCGFGGKEYKGLSVSEKHANFILNTGGAKPKDFLTLVEIIRSAVFGEFGIKLENEFESIGDIL